MTDYSTVTETPGHRVTREAIAMVCTRYAFAASFCEGRAVLEVACGAGPGLGYLARKAQRIVGGDYTPALLANARRHYQRRVPLVQFDAHDFPFAAQSFDVVVLHEAVYYLAKPERFLEESRRVLGPSGALVLSTVNREWSDFNPSPFSTRYLSARELADLVRVHGFDVDFYGAFPVRRDDLRARVVSLIRRVAVTLHAVPKTMKGKELLKRMFLGRLESFPVEVVDGIAPVSTPVPLSVTGPVREFKVLFAVGRRR